MTLLNSTITVGGLSAAMDGTGMRRASPFVQLGGKRRGMLSLLLVAGLMPAGLMAQQAPVNLGTAGNYVILSKTGITNVPPSPITGNIGASPITGAAIGVTCAEVNGTISAVDAAGPAPCSLIVPLVLTVAISDMEAAYTDAAGRAIPDFTELYAGNLSGRTLVPGLYKWSTGVLADATGFTLSGGPNDVWIFQIAGDLTLANGATVTLAGGARATNIFWQIGGPTGATLGTGSRIYGSLLASKQVILNTGATLIGRALSQTQVTLQSTTVSEPGALVNGLPVVEPPTVISTTPVNLATQVPIGNDLTATFSTAMNPSTINSTTFLLQSGVTPVAGVVTYTGITGTFNPAANLAPNTLYTATITTGAQDLAGTPLAANYVWTFTTGAVPDTTAPTVISTNPANGATNEPVSHAVMATFSEAMNPATITGATFRLANGATAVAGTVTYSGVTASFRPASNLAPNTLYTATITTGATDLAGNPLASNYVWTFTTGNADSIPPSVSSVIPVGGSSGVFVSSALAATFSEAMDPVTINSATFSLRQGATLVPGTVSYAGVTGTFRPVSELRPDTLYTATITTGAKDLAGNPLTSPYVWSFTTGSAVDQSPPSVTFTIPANGANNVAVSQSLAATFSEVMDPTTIDTATFTLKQGNTAIAGTVSYAGVTATFTPSGALAPNSLYTATISTGAKDLAGNSLGSAHVWTFTTGSASDTTAPAVISSAPAAGAVEVTVTSNLSATFSEFMNPLTINTVTFLLRQGVTAVAGTVTYSGVTATFRPANNLAPNTVYTATITTGAKDLAGNSLPANYQWTFTTGETAGQTSVCLSNFAVLAGVSISGSGSNVVTGDLGVSPGTSVTGFPPGTLNGSIHAADVAASQAMADLATAYGDAVSRSVGRVTIAGDLGGLTFTAGLYRSTSSLAILSGDLILDAKGDANAVFIFQMASTLTTGAGRQIILNGGAKAYNVYWLVGTSATLGSGSAFKGSILADQSITLNTGATVNGRLLARFGSVTLQSNTITSPPPSIAVGGIFNAAGDSRPVAPGSIAAVFGYNLGASIAAATTYPLPLTLGGSSFVIGGTSAPLFMTSCSQANMQVPWEVAGQTQAPVTATVGGLISSQEPAVITPFAPGIFSLNQTGSGQGAVQIAPTSQLAATLGLLGRPVKRGEYISIFCTGLGGVSNQPATGAAALSSPLSRTLTLPVVSIGGVPAEVTFSGLAPGFAGLYQVNAIVPANASSGDRISLILSIGGVSSNSVTIAIE